MKTYLLNQNGETIIKQKNNKQTVQQKNTLENKLYQRKMSILARKQKELANQFPNFKNNTNVVNIETVNVVNNKPPPFIKYLHKDNQKNLIEKIEKAKREITHPHMTKKDSDKLQKKLFQKLCKVIGISEHPQGKSISFDTLNDPLVIKELYELQEKLKIAFPSDKLTALHKNAVRKQSFPGVNIVRQIFKEMGYKLKPINISEGYLGSKKLLRREYLVRKI